MDTLKVLEKARELIADPKRWTQGMYARDAAGKGTSPERHDAVCWCAEGAVMKVTREAHVASYPAVYALDAAARSSTQFDFANRVNDNHGHGEVMAMYDRAIARLKERA